VHDNAIAANKARYDFIALPFLSWPCRHGGPMKHETNPRSERVKAAPGNVTRVAYNAPLFIAIELQ
jgi:hypothetical protein